MLTPYEKVMLDLLMTERVRQKIGIRDLARRSGIAPSTLCGISKGRRRLSLETAQKIAEALGMTLDVQITLKPSCDPS